MSLAKAHWLWLTWGIAASLAGVATTINVNYLGKLILFLSGQSQRWSFLFVLLFFFY